MNDASKSPDHAEILRFGGAGTVLLVSLLAFVGLSPLLMGGIVARIVGGMILVVIMVAGTIAASSSRLHRGISIALAAAGIGLQASWLATGNTTALIALMAVLACFCLVTAVVILRHVLSFGPIYADRVHAALSVYILLALFWAAAYSVIELIAPGSFSINVTAIQATTGFEGTRLFASMVHLSIATLTSTGFGDITPAAPFARSFSQLEQLIGVFYIAVLISRLVGLSPSPDKS
jgi:hypothetical protein